MSIRPGRCNRNIRPSFYLVSPCTLRYKVLSSTFERWRNMTKRIVKITLSVFVIGTLLCGAALGSVVWHIGQSVQENCQLAQQAHPHPGDHVSALVDFMNSKERSLHDRNHKAIWTLGQLRKPEALPALQAAYTGGPCNHKKNLCQYELEKAIKLCGGTPNSPREIKH